MTLCDSSIRDYVKAARRSIWHGAIISAWLIVFAISIGHDGYSWMAAVLLYAAGCVSGSSLMIYAFVRRFRRLLEEA